MLASSPQTPRSAFTVTRILVVLALAASGLVWGASSAAQEPVGPWKQYATAAEAGFSADSLRAAAAIADSVGSAAVMAVFHDRVVFAWGAVDRELEAHSVRKSLVSALYGPAVASGRIRLGATLAELGVDDSVHPLTPPERRATVEEVISARSGIYLPAAYAPASQDEERPERGSHAPGTFWFYNNWDFNAAGVIYERATGRDLYRAFYEDIARPIGMEDFTPGDGFRVVEPKASSLPAQTFRISARDLARFGLLMLRDGVWNGRRLLPEGWVARSTRRISEAIGGAGYGYMWWVYGPGDLPSAAYPALTKHALFQARGTGGQALWVVPDLDLVIVHRGDTDHGPGVRGRDAWAIAERIAGAEATGTEPAAHPRLVALHAEARSEPLLPAPSFRFVQVSPDSLRAFTGTYDFGRGATGEAFLYRGRLFLDVPGRGEAELFALGRDAFTLRVVGGVHVHFERGEAGQVRALTATLGRDTVRAVRVEPEESPEER